MNQVQFENDCKGRKREFCYNKLPLNNYLPNLFQSFYKQKHLLFIIKHQPSYVKYFTHS